MGSVCFQVSKPCTQFDLIVCSSRRGCDSTQSTRTFICLTSPRGLRLVCCGRQSKWDATCVQTSTICPPDSFFFLRLLFTACFFCTAILDATLKGNKSRFLNHSCDPNCEIQKWWVNGLWRVGIFAIRDLEVDEEVRVVFVSRRKEACQS